MQLLTENVWILTKLTYNSATWTPFGSGTITLAANSVVQTDAAGHLIATQGLDGQVLIGKTNDAPLWAYLTCPDGSILFTPGPNSLEMVSVGGGGGTTTFNTDIGGPATELAGVITVHGVSPITTECKVATPHQVDVELTASTDGQLIIGNTATGPAWATLVSSDSSVNITYTAPNINLTTAGIGSQTAFQALQNGDADHVMVSAPNGSPQSYYLGDKVQLNKNGFNIATNPNWYPGDGSGAGNYATYTIPTTSAYIFYMQITFLYSLPSARALIDNCYLQIIVGAAINEIYFDPPVGSQSSDVGEFQIITSANAGDIVKFGIRYDGHVVQPQYFVNFAGTDTLVYGYRLG
jgi:hypothetical protein